MDHPDFRVDDRIFATLWKGNGVLMLRPDQQAELVKSNPRTFTPVKGGWGRKGSTTVHLNVADEDSVRLGMLMAWTNKSKKRKEQPVRAVAGNTVPKREVTVEEIWKVGARFLGVVRSYVHGSPALKVKGRGGRLLIMVAVPVHKSAEPDSLMVRVDRKRRAVLLKEAPELYYVTDHYLDYDAVLVRLRELSPDSIRPLLLEAYDFVKSGKRTT
jgi:hypothetical protein